MRFKLTEEQRQLQDAVRRLAEAGDTSATLRKVVDGDVRYDEAQWGRLCEFGAAGLIVPEEHGGAGLTFVEVALIAEVLGHSAAAVPLFGHALATLAIDAGGSPEQKARWLPALATGERVGTIATAERGGRWEPESWTLDGDASVTGEKANVPHGLDADVAIVGLAGGGLGVVDLTGDGVERRAMDVTDRTRPLAVLRFKSAPVDVLAGEGAAARLRDASLALLAADAVGGGLRCVEMATEYAGTREAFGAKIVQFQAVKHQLANMALEVEPCRGLYWYAAYRCATAPDEAAHVAALAKAHVCSVFSDVSRLNIELHGGIGYTWEYDAHIWMKRAMHDHAWGGTSGHHLSRAADLAGW